MSTSIVVLKTGEKIITDLQEAFDGDTEDKKGICLIMRHPYELSLVPSGDDSDLDLKIEYSKWCPYAIDTEFKIPYDSVISIATPDPTLLEAYENKIKRIEEEVEQTSNFSVQQQAIEEALAQIKSNVPEQ